jgi:hypothetical protein
VVNGLSVTRQETIGGVMNWEAIGAIGEIVGGAGVIVSLLYLAIQIRKDARARRANTQFSGFFTNLFRLFENSYFQWIDGNLDSRIWNGYQAVIDDLLSFPGVQAWWASRSHWYSAEFQAVIQKKISEARGPRPIYGKLPAQQDDAEDQ